MAHSFTARMVCDSPEHCANQASGRNAIEADGETPSIASFRLGAKAIRMGWNVANVAGAPSVQWACPSCFARWFERGTEESW